MTIYISNNQRKNFKPTYLMIKEHEITGLQYLCKTISKDPIKYSGSGTHWKRHIKIYGKTYIKTIWCELYTDIDELVSIALALSENFDIVNSDRWANLKPEDGLSGGGNGLLIKNKKEYSTFKHILTNEKRKLNINDPLVLSGEYVGINKGKIFSIESRNNMSNSRIGNKHALGYIHTDATKKKISDSLKSQKGIPKKTIQCPHCKLIGGAGNMTRYHFDKCKYRII